MHLRTMVFALGVIIAAGFGLSDPAAAAAAPATRFACGPESGCNLCEDSSSCEPVPGGEACSCLYACGGQKCPPKPT